MSYPFSNLSTVVLATDIPVLPVEELRAETTDVRRGRMGGAAKTGRYFNQGYLVPLRDTYCTTEPERLNVFINKDMNTIVGDGDTSVSMVRW